MNSSYRKNDEHWWTSNYDDYDLYLQAGSPENLAAVMVSNRSASGAKLLDHPSYDAFWQQQAMDKILAAQPLKVPMMLVNSLWDQEDITRHCRLQSESNLKTQQRQNFSGDGPVAPRQEINDAVHWAR